MRTQPSTEETGAVRTQQLEATDEPGWQLALPKKNLCILTTGRLMGVTVIRLADNQQAKQRTDIDIHALLDCHYGDSAFNSCD